MNNEERIVELINSWRADWNKFVYDAFDVTLDKEQQAILSSVQHNPRTSVVSGTARGKDFVVACAAMAFLYLTPRWNKAGDLIHNTKVALTAPTDRQVKNIMMPEISRLYNRAKLKGLIPSDMRLNAYDIRTEYDEWFLTGFKADEHNHEAWSGFHAVNTMFAITEASGISESVFEAIEGNLQGNSRIILVFNPNRSVGYAAQSQKSERWYRFRLNSLTAPNVVSKTISIPGQVDYAWVQDKLDNWCTPIGAHEVLAEMDDFEFEGQWYRPEDLFRIKVLGKPPKVAENALIPRQWIEAAQERWKQYHGEKPTEGAVIGSDVAGMGRDSSVNCRRYNNYVAAFDKHHSGGRADHMAVAGAIKHLLDSDPKARANIDTIGEGAGVYSRLEELGYTRRVIRVVSCKYSEAAKDNTGNDLTDMTGQYKFANMRAYLFWAVRDWLDPKNNTGAMLPPNGTLYQESMEIHWYFRSDGRIIIEPKEDIKKRLGFSTDEFDSLANTFCPKPVKTKGIIQSGY